MTGKNFGSFNMSRRQMLGQGVAGIASLTWGVSTQHGVAAPLDFEQQITGFVQALALPPDAVINIVLPAGASASLVPVAQAFTQMTGVDVVLNEVPTRGVNAELLLERMTGGQRYDVGLPATYGLPDLAAANAIRPIDVFAAKYELRGFRDGLIYELGDRVGPDLYGYQTDGDAYLMFYHGDMLRDEAKQKRYADQFGEALGVPKTWDELDRQMAFFHQPEAGVFGGILFRTIGYVAWEWWVRLHAKGLWPFDAEMTPQIAAPPAVAALEDMIRSQQHLSPASWTAGLYQNWELFEKGNIYCNIGWGGTQKYLNRPGRPMQGRTMFGPTPGGMVQGQLVETPYFNWGWNYVVTSASLQPELSYLFALFASGPRMSTLAVSQPDSFLDPHRPEHYEDPAIQAAYSPEFLAVQRHSLSNAIPDLYLPGQVDYFRVLNDGLMRALLGQDRPADALTRVAQLWELTTSRVGRRAQIDRWADLRAQYPAQARHLLQMI